MQEFPIIWQVDAALARMAETAQSAIRLPLIVTEPARRTLIPLPFWPPPPVAAIPSMRFAVTMVRSSPGSERDTTMPRVPSEISGEILSGTMMVSWSAFSGTGGPMPQFAATVNVLITTLMGAGLSFGLRTNFTGICTVSPTVAVISLTSVTGQASM